jgi:hypothetical protein
VRRERAGLDCGRVQVAETAMGEAAGVRDLARGERRAGVPSSTAGVERPADVVGAVRGVIERRAEAAAWWGMAGAPSVAVVVAVAVGSSMVLATSAAGDVIAVRGVQCDTASCSVAAVSACSAPKISMTRSRSATGTRTGADDAGRGRLTSLREQAHSEHLATLATDILHASS